MNTGPPSKPRRNVCAQGIVTAISFMMNPSHSKSGMPFVSYRYLFTAGPRHGPVCLFTAHVGLDLFAKLQVHLRPFLQVLFIFTFFFFLISKHSRAVNTGLYQLSDCSCRQTVLITKQAFYSSLPVMSQAGTADSFSLPRKLVYQIIQVV